MMPWLAFDSAWFDRHQRGLLWLLNTPVIRNWFRWVLRIVDIPAFEPIVRIQPSHYTYGAVELGNHQIRLTTDFRTHPKFAKRLYFAFKPLWWILHAWDCVVDSWIPELSFGFDTLTAYPSAGNPGVKTVDGSSAVVIGGGGTWATLRSSNGTNADNFVQEAIFMFATPASPAGLFTVLVRSRFGFDTSAIGGGVVSAAVFSIYGVEKLDGTLSTPTISVYNISPSSNTTLSITDFQNTGTTEYAVQEITYANWTTTAYNDFTLNSAGMAAINTGGVTNLACRNKNYDVSGTPPSWSGNTNSHIGGNYADQTGTNKDPKLVVTYVLITHGNTLLLLGAGN